MDANSTRGSILIGRRPPWRRRRWLLWAGLAGLLLLPLVALAGALLVRASAVGMVRAMTSAAIAQVVTCGLAFMEGELPAVTFSAGLLVMWLSAAAGFTHAGNVEAGSADAA